MYFMQLLKRRNKNYVELGVTLGDLDQYFECKGSATKTETGTTAGLPIAVICVQANLSTGPVKDTYIQHKKGRGAICGTHGEWF